MTVNLCMGRCKKGIMGTNNLDKEAINDDGDNR